MKFLTDADIEAIMKEDMLNQITEDTDSLKDTAEKYAMTDVDDNLNQHYNVTAIFAAEGENRHASIIKIMVNLMIYYLHQRTPSGSIPEQRRTNYEDSMKWLRDVRKGEIAPKGLPVPEDDPDNPNPKQWGLWSEDKFNSSSSNY